MDVNKKDHIIDSAEKIMSEKGIKNASIAEIARNSGVADSVIYHYFKSKEDLIFSIASKRTEEVLEKLMEHLQGIRDPVSKLSKMIWFHLHHFNVQRLYAHLMLFECRSNRSFYKHEAYDYIRKYAGVMLSILEDGVRANAFRNDFNIRLVRDMIFGFLDWEILSCLAAKETETTLENFDAILDLILPMITVDSGSSSPEQDKSYRILQAAQSVFATKGYKQATITEIAKKASVAEGTIYEYFDNLIIGAGTRFFL